MGDDDSFGFEVGAEVSHLGVENGYMSKELQELLKTGFWNESSSALEAVAFGDFAHGEWRHPNHNFMAVRDPDHISGRGYRLLTSADIKYRRLLEDYGDVLTACPISRLL